MEAALQILLGIVSFICLSTGGNLLRKGAGSFLPENTPAPPALDNVFRFLSGLFFSFGILLIWIICHIKTTTDFIYLIGGVIICAGLGRLYSSIRLGSAGKKYDRMMLAELAIGIGTIVLQYFR